MLRSTENLIYALRALNRGPTPRRYQSIDDPCDKCFRVPCSCSGDSARYRRRAFHAKRRGLCAKCGEPARDDLSLCQRCADFHSEVGADWRGKCVQEGRCQRCPAQAVEGRTCCRRCPGRACGGSAEAATPSGEGDVSRSDVNSVVLGCLVPAPSALGLSGYVFRLGDREAARGALVAVFCGDPLPSIVFFDQ